jgi:hypothetical protein
MNDKRSMIKPNHTGLHAFVFSHSSSDVTTDKVTTQCVASVRSMTEVKVINTKVGVNNYIKSKNVAIKSIRHAT